MSTNPSLLEELGLDRETLSWHQLAACKGMDLRLFYEAYEGDKYTAAAMDSVCLICPVMKDCLSDAVDKKDFGLRGGIYLDNGKPDNQHNQHKSEETWQRIRERLA